MAAKRAVTPGQLCSALDKRKIVPFFQPLVHIRTGALSGFEVLARWHDPDHGMVPPDEFIPIAEKAGLIARLTESILLQAFASTIALQSNLHLSINVSPIQLRDDSLPDQIRRAAEQASFPLNQLTIEITESALMDNLEQAGSIATELKRLGVKLALDDFGTGYSSLRNLQALPFDQIKVDRSFVDSMACNRESRKIVAAVVGLGQSLKLTTVAEGIETTEQADILLWLGCELGQGWLYGRPVPAEQLPGVISAKTAATGGSLPRASASGLVAGLEPLPSHRLAQCHAIYNGAPVGLCFIDTEMRFVSINQRLARINGRSIRAHLGRRVSEVLGPELYSFVEPYILRALKGEATTGLEGRKRARPGESEDLVHLISHQPAWDEAGEVVGVSVAVVDITDRKRAEEALRESEAHYRHMVQLSPQVPWILDSNGMNIEAGPQWQRITGQTPEQTRNSGWLAAVHPDDLLEVAAKIQACIQAGDTIDIEFRVRAAEGTWLWLRSRGKPRRGPDGQILRWYGTAEDIQEHKRLELALNEAEAKIAALLNEKQLSATIAETGLHPVSNGIYPGSLDVV